MNSSKRGLCSFFVLLCALLSVVSEDQILGPLPPVVYVPVNGTATLNCSYKDFRPNTDAWFWIVNGEELGELDDPEVVGEANVSELHKTVSQHSQEPVLVMCQLFRRVGKSFLFFANSTNVSQILTYEKPSSPGNLSVAVSEEELLVSWSSPWSPPGIALNYTVTFLATSSNMKIDYHTANTTLTVDGADLTREIGFPGLCEQYQVKVVAESPAGIGPASEETVPLFNFTGNINISVCNQSNRFAFSVHLLQPGACSEGTGNYTLLLNTTNDGIYEVDINFMDGLESLVTVDWNVSSAALGVSTSNGFSRSEFYQFSNEEMADVCSGLSSTVTTSTFLPYPSLLSSPTVISLEPEQSPLVMIAVLVGAGSLALMVMVVVVTGFVVCLCQSWKQRKRRSKQQVKENGISGNAGSDKQRLSVISATHPIYQMPQDACKEYLNEQERNNRSRRTSTASLLMVGKDIFVQLACEEGENGYAMPEKSRSLPRDCITDISGYSVVPQTLKNEIKRRSSRLNGSTKSHLAKTPPLANKDGLVSPSSAGSSPPLPERNHYSLCTAEGETALSDVPPPIPPPLSAHHMTSNGTPCYSKDLVNPHIYSVPCEDKSKSSSPPPVPLRPTSSSPTYNFITPTPPVCDDVS